MIINVAGAGAGKTAKMSDLITNIESEDGKIVFCVAFTNSATQNIERRIIEKFGFIPPNIKISTIHSFLYRELVHPYYFFLYKQHFEKISTDEIPEEHQSRQAKLKYLESQNILHISKIPEKAKWVAFHKSRDRKKEINIRETIINHFKGYCTAIFVDEAQDIDSDMCNILESLDNHGIDIHLYGDPKQDIRGYGQFKELLNKNKVIYISECYRCPQNHLDISNTLAKADEQQTSKALNLQGNINIFFESDIKDISKFLSDNKFGLAYISKRNERFLTHKDNSNSKLFQHIFTEIKSVLFTKWGSSYPNQEIYRGSFHITEKVLNKIGNGNKIEDIIAECFDNRHFDYFTRQSLCLKLNNILSKISIHPSNVSIPIVSSIESIKGLEDENCLFILTNDLLPYLIKKKSTDTKTKHLLYVALTRSTKNLTILISKEVESSNSRQQLMNFFGNLLNNDP